jgi:23S rRNA U2552 (ribose-2'-O)-methylase RlmE/FtsJ
MNNSYKPFIFELPNGNSSIFKKQTTSNIIISNIISYPLFSLGYHSFLHRTKNAMEITKNLETKNKFYYVVNPFEHNISDYPEDINSITKKYFNITKDDPNIMSRAFYKMWEILYYFDIASDPNMTYAALAEGPGSFLQAVIKFREKFNFDMNKDKYFGVTIHPEENKNIEMGKQFTNYYKKKYPDLLNIYKTYPKETAIKYKSRSNGDITDVKTISLFKKEIAKTKNYADLVTADGGFEWDDENYQEQEAYMLILGEIIGALRVQNKNGHFVLKIFETFTITSLKMIYLLSSFYEKTYICKPTFSRESNSEKYLICKKFKSDQKKDKTKLDERINQLENILESMKTKDFIQDIFPDMILPNEYIDIFKFININIANKQQIMINKIVTYIKNNNYFGDMFHSYRDEQIKASKWWTDTFYTTQLDKNIRINIDNIIKYNFQEASQFSKTLVKNMV